MFKKIKDFCKKHTRALAASVTACVTTALCCFSASAAGEDPYASLNTAMTSSFTSTQQSMLTTIGNILPIVLVVVGAILVINLGIRLFKRHAK